MKAMLLATGPTAAPDTCGAVPADSAVALPVDLGRAAAAPAVPPRGRALPGASRSHRALSATIAAPAVDAPSAQQVAP